MLSGDPRSKRSAPRRLADRARSSGPDGGAPRGAFARAASFTLISSVLGACLITAPSTDELVGSCTDGIKNGEESDIDCGADCSTCTTGKRCTSDEACASRLCTQGRCEAGTCDDDAQNGDETDEDCGGSCEGCGDGSKCSAPEDCLSGTCIAQRCQTPNCEDGVKNGLEVDVDCGFDDFECPLCDDGSTCGKDDDCVSGKCGQSSICEEPSCNDELWNGNESDVDCGGSCPLKCAQGQDCLLPSDCASGTCMAFVCE